MSTVHGTHIILGAITPNQDAVDADVLSYPYLRNALQSHNLPSFLLHNFPTLFHKQAPLDTERWRENLHTAYLLTAVYRLQRAWTLPEKLFWSAQITASSSKLYGRPLSGEVSKLAHDELRYFEHLAEDYPTHKEFFEPVLRAYQSLVKQRIEIHPTIEVRYWELLRDVKRLVVAAEEEVFAVFDDLAPHEKLLPEQIAKKFGQALDVLKTRDPAWQRWKVVMNGTGKLCVDTKKYSIVVGRRRVPLPASELPGLFAHEVLVHAGRKVRGFQHSRELADGLPGQIIAEEGLGVLLESAVNGQVSRKVKDRYVDIALAMGAGRRRPLTRSELFVFCYSRAVLRAAADGEELMLDIIEKSVWEHVNRIYRGSLGNHYVGVFTKDIAYYKGFIKIAKFLERKRIEGKLETGLTYVMQGKFDPTIKIHRQYLGGSDKRSHRKR